MTRYVCEKCWEVIQEIEDDIDADVYSQDKCLVCGFDPDDSEEDENPEYEDIDSDEEH